jgi:hypothetical protein
MHGKRYGVDRFAARDKKLNHLHSRLALMERAGNTAEITRLHKLIKQLSCSI